MSKPKKGGKRLSKRQLTEVLMSFFESHPEQTLSFKEIFKQLKLTTHPLKMLAIDIMEELSWDDVLARVSDNSYRLNTKGQVQEGTFVRKANGKNSFLPDGSDKPIFVSERNSLFAMSGDRVRVALMARRRSHIKEAMVTEILERAKDTFVGTLKVDKDVAFLITDNKLFTSDVLIPKRKLKGGKTGDKAVVKIIEWPSKDSKRIVGQVIDILGKTGENTAEMHAILAQYGLPYQYPKAVEEAARQMTGEVTEQDLKEREDFRDVWTCTIDPHDAKDFDDALSIRSLPPAPSKGRGSADPLTSRDGLPLESGNASRDGLPITSRDGLPLPLEGAGGRLLYEVGVHIADVSHYVKEGSIIDKEAQKRATSIYLVDRTIPMLPEHLCNYVCSLRPDEEKLCYSVVFTLDEEANVKNYRIVHTVIKSNRRYAYEEVQAILEKREVREVRGEKGEVRGEEREYAENLKVLDRLAKKLREKRFKNGAIDFDSEEMRFDIDADGKPTRCYFKRSLDANKLIEEFMLLANRTVAADVALNGAQCHGTGRIIDGNAPKRPNDQTTKRPNDQTTKRPKAKALPYRVHDNPDPQKLEELRQFVGKFGYKMKSTGSKNATARSLNQLISESAGTSQEKLIQTVALRAMMKAKYTTYNIGHFGLAFDYYTHFTSPIRRYPDTMVHRLLTRYEQGGRSANREKYEELCEHCSEMEQVAQNAERDSIKYKMVEFMSGFIGETYDAHISGIQSFGIYCEIDENHCEGLVPMRDLDDDYYDFDEKNYCLIGRRHHRRYQLGDAIRIQVARANVEKRQLDFTIV